MEKEYFKPKSATANVAINFPAGTYYIVELFSYREGEGKKSPALIGRKFASLRIFQVDIFGYGEKDSRLGSCQFWVAKNLPTCICYTVGTVEIFRCEKRGFRAGKSPALGCCKSSQPVISTVGREVFNYGGEGSRLESRQLSVAGNLPICAYYR